ncbi:Gfo/Idh/MocA family oxidoreductase [Candidatus Poribacteria bacterium]|nr:Gfo/Idh/MocA family oxidoreductase [Candidatus Poribacteria bacterium]
MSVLRVGVIGAGANTRSRHIPGLQRLPDVKIVAICNRSVESGSRVAREFGIDDVMTDWRALIGRHDIDAVVIGTWPYMHAGMTIAALESGKHILCEARMAMNAAEARAMHEVSRRTDRVAQIVPSPRLFGPDVVLRELLAAGAIGDAREIYVRGLTDAGADPNAPVHWRHRRELSGLNVMTLGIDYEMLSRYFGHAASVMAQMRLWIASRPDPSSDVPVAADVPDSLSILAHMESGAQAVFHYSSVAVHAGPPRVEVYGTNGTLHIDLSTERLSLGSRSGMSEVIVPESQRGGWRVEEDFVDSIRTGKPVVLTSFEEGMRYMAFTEACHVSARTGRRIEVDSIC